MSISKEQAAAIVARIMADLSDRAGFDVCDVDDTTIDEWRDRWIEFVTSGATSPAPAPKPSRSGGVVDKFPNPDALRVNGGKYTFVIRHETQTIEILRYGEAWHEQRDAFNALTGIVRELDAARVVLSVVRFERFARFTHANYDDNIVAMLGRIDKAIAQHGALVDDTEPPTAWSQP